jgi:exodeoxyribonuclease VII large subunit
VLDGVRALLEEEVGRVWVVGEISNLRRAGSGHVYFTLKDDGGQLRAVLFRGTAARIPFDPEEGLEVLALGELTLYAARGDLQILVRQLEPRGQGALQLAFEQLRARLEAEGLFDAARKRPLPARPRRVGVVTSASGAALRDVIHVSGLRFASVPLLLAPTRVQGDGAEEEIAAALGRLQGIADVDVILLVRGGGSLEDLRPFNTERVARALRASRIPVVSGVGHEVDVTIADLAADARAATPSAAAALALPDRAALAGQLGRDARRLQMALDGALERARLQLRGLEQGLRSHAPAARLAARRAAFQALAEALGAAGRRRVETAGRRLERLGARLAGAPQAPLARRRTRLAGLAGRLDALSPLSVLSRGYAIARRADGTIVRRARDARIGEGLQVRVHEGELEVEVRRIAD